MRKIILMVMISSISILFGVNKKNVNKYIFAGGYKKNSNWLIVFDGKTKTIQRKRIGTNSIQGILYFPNQRRIIIRGNSDTSLYSVNIDDLNDIYQVNLKQFNRFGKSKNFIDFAKKKNNKQLLFNYVEWDTDWNDGQFGGTYLVPQKYKQGYLWNINNNTFTKYSLPKDPWEMEDDGSLKLIDDPYEARDIMLYKMNDKDIKVWKSWLDKNEYQKNGDKRQKKAFKTTKRLYEHNKKFLKLLKKGKIDVGNYDQISDLEVRPTGGRYMVVRNDKLYLVHMKTKKVYTLMDNPFRELRYFIIEKNEDDVDLDAE